MNKLSLNSCEEIIGGELTREELRDFAGAIACTSVFAFKNILSAVGCYLWLTE